MMQIICFLRSKRITRTLSIGLEKFCGLNIDWHYNQQYVNISIPNYIRDTLIVYQHSSPNKNQPSPQTHTSIRYESTQRQNALESDKSEKLSKDIIKYMQ